MFEFQQPSVVVVAEEATRRSASSTARNIAEFYKMGEVRHTRA